MFAFRILIFVLLLSAILIAYSVAQQGNPNATSAAAAQIPVEVKGRLEKLQSELQQAQAAGDTRATAKDLDQIGLLYFGISEYQKALEFYDRALPIFRAVGDRAGEGAALTNIGRIYDNLGDRQKALELLNQALPIERAVRDRASEAETLNDIGAIDGELGEKQEALDFLNHALLIRQAAGDRAGEAETLDNIGVIYWRVGDQRKALEFYNQTLPIRRVVGDRAGEGETLSNIAAAYSDLGEEQKALEFLNQALPIQRAVGDREGEATTLNNMALVYDDRGQKRKALEFYGQALSIYRAVGDRSDEANTLSNIGFVYADLGERQKALEFYNQALPIWRAAGDRRGEATTLNNVGAVYRELGDQQKSLEIYNQALPIWRAVGDRHGEATTLNNIGRVYRDLGEQQKALEFYNQALPILRTVGNRRTEAVTLDGIGRVYEALGEKQKALEFYNQALPLAVAIGDPLHEVRILGDLMALHKAKRPALAIFYGKEAGNLLQRVRGNIQGLDNELQTSFVSSKSAYYHQLADLLISQGRLPEALEVLDLLKEQEYRDYVRGQSSSNVSQLSLTPAERQAEDEYQKSTAELVSLGRQYADLKKVSSRTPEQEKQYQQLSSELDQASKGLNDYYSRLYEVFGSTEAANEKLNDVKGNVSILQQEVAKLPHTVALYTAIAKEELNIIVITGSGPPIGREYPIAEDKLTQKVALFMQVLRDPAQDPRPLAKELYDIIVGPARADLEQAQAETLVWSLDGALRYVPMAALYDGTQYLVEKYNMVTITPESVLHLGEKPDVSNLNAVAMGIARQYEKDLMPLPAVAGELKDIVRAQGSDGVLPGTMLLDGQFTEKAMETQFDGAHPIVHIATHFVLKPGDDTQSYLLLAGKDADEADGYHLTEAEFRDDQKLTLDDTELLTLSACQTGIASNAENGREVDGLGITAQRKGAKAVISSLWEVNDASTGELMADFYKRWADGGGKVMKVEALRQAQLDLLMGRIKPEPNPSDPHAPSSFAHPYYWAPFVLMGNWR